MTMQDDARQMIGFHVIASDQEDLGTIEKVYLDNRTQQPEFVSVKGGGLFGRHESLVPLQGARLSGEELRVPFDKETVKDAPDVGTENEISPDEGERLYRHYGLRRSDLPAQQTGDADRMGQDMPDRRVAGTQSPDGSDRPEEVVVTRYEEEMHVGTERREAGHAHVRKRVEAEDVERTVPVSHEELQVTREPIADGERMPDAGDDLDEDEQEITLYEERPVVSTERVPVERVRISKSENEDQETIRGQVHKEHIDVDQDEDQGPNSSS